MAETQPPHSLQPWSRSVTASTWRRPGGRQKRGLWLACLLGGVAGGRWHRGGVELVGVRGSQLGSASWQCLAWPSLHPALSVTVASLDPCAQWRARVGLVTLYMRIQDARGLQPTVCSADNQYCKTKKGPPLEQRTGGARQGSCGLGLQADAWVRPQREPAPSTQCGCECIVARAA